MTLVTFEISEAPGRTALTVTETGFERLPPGRRESAFTSNDGGWALQIYRSSRNALSMRPSRAAPVFAALGDETRLGLLCRPSAEGPLSIMQLTQGAGVSRRAITKHLCALSDAGLVRSRRRGRERIWQVEPRRLGVACGYLERISAAWDAALDRLRGFVENGH